MTPHSSNIPPHFWHRRYVTPTYSYHFLFAEEVLACHGGHLFLQLFHKFTALSRTTTWHAIAWWWDEQHFHTGATLSSEWLLAAPSRQLSVLCAALSCEAIFVTHSIWFSHMAMGCLVKPGAGLSSPAKEFHSAFMSLMGLFIMSLSDWVDTLLWRVETHHVHF